MKIESLRDKEFNRVYRNGQSKANKYLVMYVLKEQESSKIGISVSKKVGNSVIRHRVKRLIKESYRLNRKKLKDNVEIVIIARNTAKGKSYAEMESALLHLAKLHNIVL